MEPNLPAPNKTTSPKRHCLICSEVIQEGSYCDNHQEDLPNRWGESNNDSFYQKRKWRRISKKYRRLNPLCEHCKQKGLTTPATQVDHIKPIEQGGHKYSFDNLQALCRSCHARKTKKERQHG